MREILFRGKRVDNGEWAYGSLICDYDIDLHEIIGFEYDLTEEGEVRSPFDVIIDYETVGQYTGLKDRNGNRIFEGDIVNYNGTIHKVVFENRFGDNAYFGIVISEIETWQFSNMVPASRMEIIGNIHDNPELLKGVVKDD